MSRFFQKESAGPSNRSQYRNWCFTLNNYNDKDLSHINGFVSRNDAVYCAYQPEVGASGNRHLQGVLVFKNARRLGGLRRLFCIPERRSKPESSSSDSDSSGLSGSRSQSSGISTSVLREGTGSGCRAHFEPMRGTFEQAVAYCSKEETRDAEATFGFREFGVAPVGRGAGGGSRSDLVVLSDAIRGGSRGRDLFEGHPGTFLRYSRSIGTACSFYESNRAHVTEVYWYYGPTGKGKSRAARDEAGESAYWKNPTDGWWDGYTAQSEVVIDDYRKDFCKFSDLLRLFDRYPLRLQFKGGSVSFVAKKVWLTTPFHPLVTWSGRTEEDIEQLMRRLTIIKEFN